MANWDLFREFDKVQRQIDEVLRGFGARKFFDQTFMPGPEFQRAPRINLVDVGDTFKVSALLPGVAVDDLEMTVQTNTLTLSGERKEEVVEGATWHRKERGGGKFLRTIELPVDIDTDKVTAEYREGILHITLPKAEAAKPRRIEVKAL
ncbi:MAG: Hsp20/alpha crystallin family protein [Syntrophotaleaceae bacterium]